MTCIGRHAIQSDDSLFLTFKGYLNQSDKPNETCVMLPTDIYFLIFYFILLLIDSPIPCAVWLYDSLFHHHLIIILLFSLFNFWVTYFSIKNKRLNIISIIIIFCIFLFLVASQTKIGQRTWQVVFYPPRKKKNSQSHPHTPI